MQLLVNALVTDPVSDGKRAVAVSFGVGTSTLSPTERSMGAEAAIRQTATSFGDLRV